MVFVVPDAAHCLNEIAVVPLLLSRIFPWVETSAVALRQYRDRDKYNLTDMYALLG